MSKTRGAAHGLTVAAQDIYEASTTQMHRIGQRLPIGDRVFRYCKAGAAIANPYTRQGCINYNKPVEGDRPATAYAVGATDITMTTIGGSNSVSYTTADRLADGYVWFQSDPSQLHRIRKNTANSGTTQVITLYDGITTALVATASGSNTMWTTMWPNIYSDVRQADADAEGYASVVCIPLIEVASGSYFWGQTWGPVFMTAGGTAPGKTVGYRQVWFHHIDGSAYDVGDRTAGQQVAGYILARTTSSDGDQLVMLQLSP